MQHIWNYGGWPCGGGEGGYCPMTYILESSFYEQYLPRRYFASIMYRLEVIWHQSWQCIKKCNIFGLLGQLHGATPQALVTGNINLTDIVCSLSWTVKNYKVSKSAMLEKCNILALWGWPKGIIAPRLIYFSKALVELMLSSNWHVGLYATTYRFRYIRGQMAKIVVWEAKNMVHPEAISDPAFGDH